MDNVNQQYHEELLKNQEIENIIENESDQNEISFRRKLLKQQSQNRIFQMT